jgi:hypothetical protein
MATMACPFCSEEIQETARKCRFCSEWLVPREAGAADAGVRPSPGDAWAAGPMKSSSVLVRGAGIQRPSEPSTASQGGPPRTNGLAIAALVTGLGVLLMGAIAGIPALIMGLLARRRIDESSGREVGRGMATAGVVLGGVSVLITVLAIVLVLGRGNPPARPTPSGAPFLIGNCVSNPRPGC